MGPGSLPWMMAGFGGLRPWSTGTLNVLASVQVYGTRDVALEPISP